MYRQKIRNRNQASKPNILEAPFENHLVSCYKHQDTIACDCGNANKLHQLGIRGYEKVSNEDELFDSLMVQENCRTVLDPATFAAVNHSPVYGGGDVVHLNMNIVQVVHHAEDSSKCTEDGCKDGAKPNLANILDKNPNALVGNALPYKATTTIITVDQSAEEIIKRIVDHDDNSKASDGNKDLCTFFLKKRF